MEFLVRFAQVYESFRLPEIQALASLQGIPLSIVSYDDARPFSIIKLGSEDDAKNLIKRSILVQSIYELWASAKDLEGLKNAAKRNQKDVNVSRYEQASFRFRFDGFQGKRSKNEQKDIIESFSFLNLQGPIKMTDVDLQLCISEYYERHATLPSDLYLGRWIADSNRDIVAQLDLKKRRYIGLTSMDAELSLVTANLTHAAAGKIMYDPFVGTGSFSVACARFGAAALGSDIDGRTVRGSSSCNHLSNYAQYNLESNFLDNFIADLTNTPLLVKPWLDGIICDPPYGVREGPRVLGYRDEKDTTPVNIDGEVAHMRRGYIPPKRPYGFDDMLQDVLDFAVVMLVPNGRVSMWMPTANDENAELAIPTNAGLELLSICVQKFNKWSRRLLTYRRLPEVAAESALGESMRERAKGNADDLNSFRKKYFQGFR